MVLPTNSFTDTVGVYEGPSRTESIQDGIWDRTDPLRVLGQRRPGWSQEGKPIPVSEAETIRHMTKFDLPLK